MIKPGVPILLHADEYPIVATILSGFEMVKIHSTDMTVILLVIYVFKMRGKPRLV
jgi:hypothetical protein